MKSAIRQASRYADALRHMRRSQVAGRSRRLVPERLLAVGLRRGAPPGWRPLAAGMGVHSAPQSGPTTPPDRSGTFSAVGQARTFPASGFWTDDGDGLLFLFALHGFSDLAEYAAGPPTRDGDDFWTEVLESWLAECGEPSRPGWHPYPTSGRILAWSAALSRDGWDDGLRSRMTASLWRQARFLARSVERDIGGNHVLHNAAALIVAGSCLQAPRLQRRALRLLCRELAAQVLPDGGHEERSPSYQREIVEELVGVRSVLQSVGAQPRPWLDAAIDAMHGWLRAVAGPDGALPLLNDAWEGPGLAQPSDLPVRDLDHTGYVVLRDGGDQAVLDVAPVSPDHLPAHAHADVLSFVLWGDGKPVVVDPGAYTYAGPDRAAFRSTAAHNTVEVDGVDQCDLWGPFRAAGLPRVERLRTDVSDQTVIVVAQHDGYRALPDPVVHRRAFCWMPGDGLVVVDTLRAASPHHVRTSIHLAPGVSLDSGGRAGPFRLEPFGDLGPAFAERARYAPYLGRAEGIEVIRRAGEVTRGQVFGWALLRGRATVTVTHDGVRIERSGDRPLEVAL